MFHFGKKVIKCSIAALVLWGGYAFINQNPQRAEDFASKTKYAVQLTEEKTGAALDKTSALVSENTALASQAWGKIGLERKADDLQDSVRPIRTSLVNTARPVTRPVVKAGHWMDNKMSLIGILFILIAGSMVAVMSVSMLNDDDYK